MPSPRLLLTLLIGLLLVACPGCAPKNDSDATVLWTAFEGAELTVLREIVADFEAQTGHRVNVLKVPFSQLQGKVLVAGPAQQGPDLLIGPHDWIGLLHTAGLLAPIPTEIVDPATSTHYPVALQAATFAGQLYQAPMMLECVVLARNVELCPDSPESLEDLVLQARQSQERHPDSLGFVYELDNFYFSWAFMAGFGADFLAPFRAAELDLDSLDLATPEAVAGAEWIASLRGADSLVPPGMRNEMAVDMFLRGRLAMMLCGPWNVGDIRRAGIDYVLEPIPPGPTGPSSPFVGATGVMLSRYARPHPGVHQLLRRLASAETGARLCLASGRAPAQQDTAALLEDLLDDPQTAQDLQLFSKASQNGTPLPNHPSISALWEPMKQALELITTGQTQALSELERTTERVRSKIRFMME